MTDYQTFTNISTPLKERRRLDVGDIWANEIKCKKCEDIIRSKNRHNMVYCKCQAVFVDGGSWYSRRGGKDVDLIEDRVVMYKDLEKTV